MNLHEMLMAREELIYDIECIIDSHFGEIEYKDDVIKELCDAVCEQIFIPDES